MSTHASSLVPAATGRAAVWRHIFAGLCAGLVSIGLARFAYTPLVPSLIQSNWFSAADVVYLGAANLAGYLAGALLGRPIAARLSNVHTLRLMMLLVTASFLACAVPLSVDWFFAWRFASGVAGGAIMVLVAATVLPHVPVARRGVASGAIFLGLGLGIAGSGTIVPLLMNLGLQQTWIGLAILSAVLTAASWFAWPLAASAPGGPASPAAHAPAHTRFGGSIHLFYVQYALMAAGLVPAMMFLVDFVARGMGAGAHLGSMFWVLYGVGAIAGPPLYGLLADRMGPRPAVRLILVVQAVALAIFHQSHNLALLACLTIVVGTFPPGIVPLALARVHEAIPHNANRQNVAWSRATTLSAAAMAAAGYAFSAIFNASGGNHRLVMLVSAGVMVVALLLDLGRPKRLA